MTRTNTIKVALAVALVLSWGQSPAGAITRRADRLDSQYTSLADNSFPYGGTVWGNGWLGSATLISPNWILTAAHVLSGTITFQTKTGTYNIVQQIAYPGLDIGLARLANPLNSISPIKLYSLNYGVEDGKPCTVMGAGQSGTGLTGEVESAGTRRAAQTYVYTNASAWGWGSENVLTWFRAPGQGAADLEGGSAHGDSGGGILLNVGGEWTIAGVMSQAWWGGGGGDTIGKYNTGGLYVRSAPLNTWITQYATDAVIVPEPASLAFVCMMGGMLLRRRR